jgi:putative tricarboxylic transport membrane protein
MPLFPVPGTIKEDSMRSFAFALLTLFAGAAAAQNIKMLVPANPGGGWDQTGRALAQAMQSAGVAKNVRVENRGGAGGTIGIAQFVNTSKGDPDALMVGGLVMVGAIELNKSPVTLAQVTPIARLTAEYEVIVVPGGSKIRSMKDLLAAFKASPKAVSWGGGSAGGVDHILVGLIAKEIGADARGINYIPYAGGGEAVASILGGHVTAGVSGWGEFAQHIASGKMRGLAVSSPARMADGKNIPTLKEVGVNLEVNNWRGVFAAPGISSAQRDNLVKLITATVKSPAWRETLKRNDWTDVLQTGDAFKSYIDEEQKRVAVVLKEIGLAK